MQKLTARGGPITYIILSVFAEQYEISVNSKLITVHFNQRYLPLGRRVFAANSLMLDSSLMLERIACFQQINAHNI